MKKNPIHSFLYKEYKNQVEQINKYQPYIAIYKKYISLNRDTPHLLQAYKKSLKQTREKLKYHQQIIRYLKHEILFYNSLLNPKPCPNKNIIHVKSVLYSTNYPQHIIVNLKTKRK